MHNFNNILDVPAIISADKFAFLEPQEQIWERESGRSFSLQELSGSDHLTSLHGIAGFDAGSTVHYPKTLFRFPLRSAASSLSDNIYTVEKVNELISALKSEAKFLLLFLRSVHTIEVYNIDQQGRHTLSFQVKVADSCVQDLKIKRAAFLQDLASLHSTKQYNFSKVIKFTAKFDVCVENPPVVSTSHWLVANRIDTTNSMVRAASVQQKVFPWVGAAVELDSPGDGRIFCFLPMPIETASNLPVHVNGTFGLNDDRRSIKWPGVERRNDLSAKWNQMLVKDVIPSCYVDLLLDAKLIVGEFYNTWPDIDCLEDTQWEAVLRPVLSALCSQSIILSKSGWVTPNAAVYIPRDGTLAEVVKTVLIACGVKLAYIPPIVWRAFTCTGISAKEVSPLFFRNTIRASPSTYASSSQSEKLTLLEYCLSDEQYSQLDNLQLLPLADGKFTTFVCCGRRSVLYSSSLMYITTADCPRALLPNMDHRLVHISSDTDLQTKLTRVAQSNTTQLRVLDASAVAALLNEAIPQPWRNAAEVTMPHRQFPSEWFPLLWRWLRTKQLSLFESKIILPVNVSGVTDSRQFNVVRLLPSQPLLYFPSYSKCSSTLQSVLQKLGILYCTQECFPYVEHQDLATFIKAFSPSALLEVMVLKGDCASVTFTSEEAQYLRSSFSQIQLSGASLHVLKSLRVFSSCVNSSNRLYSINDASGQSLLREAVLQPSNTIDLSVLPSSIVIFSSREYYQKQLLSMTKLGCATPDDVNFLTRYILPYIPSIGDSYVDGIMTNVLDMYQSLRYTSSSITTSIQNLTFVRTGSGGRKCPSELFNPHDSLISSILWGENVFPADPYNSEKNINVLKQCGLRTSLNPQKLLDVIFSISLPKSSSPQSVNEVKMYRSRAILQHLEKGCLQENQATYRLDPTVYRGYGGVSFQRALELLSSQRSWLPVLSERPSNYPSCLPWKGNGCNSHFVSLSGPVIVSSSSSPSLPLIFGSQAFFTPPCDQVKADKPEHLLIGHFENVIACKDKLTEDQMILIVCEVYSAMLNIIRVGVNAQVLNKLVNMKEWVYIKKYHKFVSVGSVALKQSSTFSQNIEPYLYILPDSISAYSQLFKLFGMNDTITRPQIVSMLRLIKEEVHLNPSPASSKASWSTVMAILNWLTEDGTKLTGSESIYVPVESDSKWPDLREPSELVYADNDYLKSFISLTESGSSRAYVHSRVNQRLAKCLHITPLSEELDISEDTFEDAGQHEPLIVRLKNILQDYKDGLTIVKELIQNADDAEATEVNICYDARTHRVEEGRLFFPDMCESHGPALVIQNNSTFSNEDFVNIQKLAGATKQNKHLKIGKFGVGFCSVYHITDIPSFVSRERLYIFDPTLKHLRKAVKNPSQPGKRVNYLARIIASSKQMEPYNGLFGFRNDMEYKGTMFRLPFRTSASELSSTCYSESTVRDLIDGIQQCGDNLLLFLQHVKCITVQRFDPGRSSPEVLYKLCKPAIPQTLSLVDASLVAVEVRNGNETCINNWLVTSHVVGVERKPAVASVACKLSRSGHRYTVQDSLSGEVFCYLPLAQTSGLPVHVSCNFAVVNNRRGLWTSESGDQMHAVYNASSANEVKWNIHLMRKVIPLAYMKLLNSLMAMHSQNLLECSYSFHSLWPLSSKLQQKNPWDQLVDSLYKLLLDKKLFYSVSTSKWLTFKESEFLEAGILGNTGTDSLPCVLKILYQLAIPLVDLPSSYRDHLPLSSKVIQEERFIRLFFHNLSALSAVQPSRNEVVYHLLKTYASQKDTKPHICKLIKEKLNFHSCISTSPDGSLLRKCAEVVDPNAPFSRLFDECDRRFPIKRLTDDLAITALKQAGMMHSSLPWELVIERAHSVRTLMETDQSKALQRVSLILHSISDLRYVSGEPPSGNATIDAIPFLPVMKKPNNYPLSWFGDKWKLLPGNQLSLPAPTFTEKDANLNIAGSQLAFLCEEDPRYGGCGRIYSENTKKLLKLRSVPDLHEVTAHLRQVIAQYKSQTPPTREWISKVCRGVYEFIDTLCQRQPELVLSELKAIPCIWNGDTFLEVNSIALNWNSKCGPYLYRSPPEVASKKVLSDALGIKENFNLEDATRALRSMESDFGSKPIDKACFEVISEIIPIFQKASPEEVKSLSEIYLPDTNNILHPSADLVYNDVSWAPLDENCILVHKDFPRDLAISLGVRLERSKLLEQYVSKKEKHFRGDPFGQHEELTRRIQNIIRDYPFNTTILKELLQNTDDAKAKKMYIILDKRTHGKESVISKEWQDLQGPALLVWNDSTFTERDLKGIQELGLGSKRSDAESIGQFGIGFNVVYHITDCPSFVTGGDTLCVLDPHCRYVQEAKVTEPGARYDNLKKGFWREFEDMASAYLQTGINNVPEELRGGSLFRFPIRHSHEMIKSSKIIRQEGDSLPTPLSADTLSNLMKKWMPFLKQAMFFLNNVKEIKYFEIDNDKSLQVKYFCKTAVVQSQVLTEDCKRLKHHVSEFTQYSGCKSCTILYPLTLTEVDCSGNKRDRTEKWLVQQGIGDINNEGQYWQYVKTAKPKHAIAASLKHSYEDSSGTLFCFLPLPVKSGVPVHINGSFALDSTRKGLWVSSDPDGKDDKTNWNNRLHKALASSYATFLVRAREYFFKPSYKRWPEALEAVGNYYKLFPTFTSVDVSKKWDSLPCDVYKSLIQSNTEVLCVLVSGNKKDSPITVEWHRLISEDESEQVHFWSRSTNRKVIQPILQSIGLKITPASPKVMDCFNSAFSHLEKKPCQEAGIEADARNKKQKKIPGISPSSVFKFYTEHSQLSSLCDMKKCHISQTIFCDSDTFLVFVKYLVEMELDQPPETKSEMSSAVLKTVNYSNIRGSSRSTSSTTDPTPAGTASYTSGVISILPSETTKEFPMSPFSHFLLLTADGNLTRFDSENKVLNSKFSNLYGRHLDKFLHPVLKVVRFDSTYFVQPEDDPDRTLKLLLGIIEGTFPSVMKIPISSNEVPSACTVIKKEKLQQYWECFKKDKVFSKYLLKLLKHWALLLTTDNRLFSTTSGVLPAYLPPPPADPNMAISNLLRRVEQPDSTVHSVCAIMKSLRMPFLDKSVVVTPVSDCPELTDRQQILANFYHTNKAASLTQFLSNEKMDVLIRYFSQDSRPGNEEWLKMIKSLPLFEDVAGKYQPILSSDVFVWPANCCESGYSKWMHGTNAIFIKDTGTWTSLGSADQLSVCAITSERLYTTYIFQQFDSMSEHDRYKHLDHIRKFIYPTAKSYSELKKNNNVDRKTKISDSKAFLQDLKRVKCIGQNSLRPISAFCDHTVEIFRVFSDDFQSLPEKFHSRIWLDFLNELGLKRTLEQYEYLDLCNKVEERSVKNVSHCSAVLLEYLFFQDISKVWYKENDFLQQVSNIAFVPTVNTASINWIMPQGIVSLKNQLVKLNGAASDKLKRQLWTVKSIIHLPYDCISGIQVCDTPTITMLTSMNICFKAELCDVVANVENISQKSPLSNSSHFNNYPPRLMPPKESESLLSIMADNFLFLNQHADDDMVKPLQEVTCIPVYCDLLEKKEEKMVLVKPSSVLVKPDIVEEYHPYLHCMPVKFMNYLSVLQTLGVSHTLELHHMQIVLERIFTASREKKLVDPNVDKCMKKALSNLMKTLQQVERDHHTVKAASVSLNPLYLPDIDNALKLSTTMIYSDTSSFFGQMQINLSGTGYFHFGITKKSHGVDASSLCALLPEKVRPMAMSAVCQKILSKDCRPTVYSETSSSIEKKVRFEGNPSSIAQIFSKFLPTKVSEIKMKELVTAFISSLTVFTMDKLCMELFLKESGMLVGHLESEFYFDESILYIDYNFDDEDGEIIDEIIEKLNATITNKFGEDFSREMNAELYKAIKKYLKSDTPEKKEKLLQRYDLSGCDINPVVNFSFGLGEEVPKVYFEWLDFSPYNIFKPMEYVGYEDKEGHIIVAQVVYLVQEEGGEEEDHLHRVYYIHLSSKEDAEGKEVSILDLYKFLMDKNSTSTDNQLVPYVPEDETTAFRRSLYEDNSTSEIKEKLLKELREIWKLDPELRRKAVKRLYLKWHPDKNLDYPEKAQEIFTYLKEQIDLLKSQDQDAQDLTLLAIVPTPRGSSSSGVSPAFPFDNWDNAARVQRVSSMAKNAPSPFNQVNRDSERPNEGWRWVRQAEVDYNILCEISSTADTSNGYGHVCFMAHQVVEKALKGGVYALCGMDGRGLTDHNLTRHARALETARPASTRGLSQHASPLESYYVDTRYPNRWPSSSDIPSDHYNAEEADEAQQHALAVLKNVKSIIP